MVKKRYAIEELPFYRESKMKERDIVSYKKREWPEFLKIDILAPCEQP